jgi:hypothetical protein
MCETWITIITSTITTFVGAFAGVAAGLRFQIKRDREKEEQQQIKEKKIIRNKISTLKEQFDVNIDLLDDFIEQIKKMKTGVQSRKGPDWKAETRSHVEISKIIVPSDLIYIKDSEFLRAVVSTEELANLSYIYRQRLTEDKELEVNNQITNDFNRNGPDHEVEYFICLTLDKLARELKEDQQLIEEANSKIGEYLRMNP